MSTFLRRLLGVFALVALTTGSALAQGTTLSGTVIDDDGQPLPGVTVRVISLQRGAVTNIAGEYRFEVPANNRAVTLTAQFLGFRTVERSVTLSGGTVTQDFTLSADLLNIDEVIVSGVGVGTSRERLSVDIESVDAADLQDAPAPDLGSSLAGKVAGANITSLSGQPGVAPFIQLRGISTIGSTTPMVLIDGVEVSTDNNFGGTGQNPNSRLADIDFSDVERVEIVKGAAGGTIYGAQGANGVIQIFTRTGQSGAPRLTLTSSVGAVEPLGSVDKAEFHYFPTRADGTIEGATFNAATGQWTLPSASIGPDTVNDNPFVEQTFDQLDSVLRTAVEQRYGASLSGGSDDVTYLVSANFYDQEGVQQNTFQTRGSYRANVGIRVLPNLNLAVRTNFIDISNRGTENGNNVTAPLSSALFAQQYINLDQRDADGNVVATPIEGDNGTNPVFEYTARDKSINNVRFIAGVNADYQPLPWLDIRYTLGVDRYDYEYDEVQFNNENYPGTVVLAPLEGFVQRVADQNVNITSTANAFIRYTTPDENIASTTQLGFDLRDEEFEQTESYGQGLPPFRQLTNLASTGEATVNQFFQTFRTYGALINQTLEYKGMVGVSGGGRVDYSSAFGEGQDPRFFPRASAFARLPQLGLDLLPNLVPEFKVRAAYGEAGIQPGAFDRIPTLAQTNIGGQATLIAPQTLQNALLIVENSQEFEVGFDSQVQLGRRAFAPLSTSFTYWSRSSDNVIQGVDLPPSSGSTGIVDNSIRIDSQGFDIALDAVALSMPTVNWLTSLNFGRFNSTVGEISTGEDIIVDSSYLLREGTEVGSHFGFRAIRDINETDPDSGDLLLDRNGDGAVNAADGNFEILDGYVVDADQRTVQFRPFQEFLGDPSPDFVLGFRNDFRFGRSNNVRAGFQLDWVQGPEIYNRTRQWLYRDQISADFDEAVTIGGETAPFVRYYQSIYKTNDKNEFFLEDGSFVRLREAYLAYDFADLLGGTFNSFVVRVSGRNLLTFTDYTGFDPEVSANGGNSVVRGLDEFTYPNFRTFNVSTQIRF